MESLGTIDLHTHSTASDGSLTPADVVRLAREEGLRAVALTDHDTVGGIAEARDEANRSGIESINGIEVSCAFPRPGTMHLLGYHFDVEHPSMQKLLTTIGHARAERAGLIVRQLCRLGMDVSVDEVRRETGGVGRPHFAKVLVKKGYVISRNEAFRKYLGGAGAAWVDNLPLMAEQVIPMIRDAGGVVSLAHPFQLRRQTFAQVEAVLRELAEHGLDGVETIHSSHDTEAVQRLTRLADRLDLLTTGGSDYHGPEKSIRLGRPGGRAVPYLFLDQLRRRVSNRRASRAAA